MTKRREEARARMAETAGRYRQALDQADTLIAAGHTEPDGDITPALGVALAEPPDRTPGYRWCTCPARNWSSGKRRCWGCGRLFEGLHPQATLRISWPRSNTQERPDGRQRNDRPS